MADRTIRSTGNRRAVRNALFRSMMDRRKLRESDLYRIKYVDEGPARITTFGPPRYADPTCDLYLSPPAPGSIVYVPPLPHPLLRWWRRLLWGE